MNAPLRNGRLPLNLVEQFAKPAPLGRVHHFQEREPTFKVRAKVLVPAAILAVRTQSNAICERGLQAIEVLSGNIQSFVYNQSGKALANTLPHNSRFAMMHGESFVHHGRAHVKVKPLGDPFEVSLTRECKIVRVPCVNRPGRSR